MPQCGDRAEHAQSEQAQRSRETGGEARVLQGLLGKLPPTEPGALVQRDSSPDLTDASHSVQTGSECFNIMSTSLHFCQLHVGANSNTAIVPLTSELINKKNL